MEAHPISAMINQAVPTLVGGVDVARRAIPAVSIPFRRGIRNLRGVGESPTRNVLAALAEKAYGPASWVTGGTAAGAISGYGYSEGDTPGRDTAVGAGLGGLVSALTPAGQSALAALMARSGTPILEKIGLQGAKTAAARRIHNALQKDKDYMELFPVIEDDLTKLATETPKTRGMVADMAVGVEKALERPLKRRQGKVIQRTAESLTSRSAGIKQTVIDELDGLLAPVSGPTRAVRLEPPNPNDLRATMQKYRKHNDLLLQGKPSPHTFTNDERAFLESIKDPSGKSLSPSHATPTEDVKALIEGAGKEGFENTRMIMADETASRKALLAEIEAEADKFTALQPGEVATKLRSLARKAKESAPFRTLATEAKESVSPIDLRTRIPADGSVPTKEARAAAKADEPNPDEGLGMFVLTAYRSRVLENLKKQVAKEKNDYTAPIIKHAQNVRTLFNNAPKTAAGTAGPADRAGDALLELLTKKHDQLRVASRGLAQINRAVEGIQTTDPYLLEGLKQAGKEMVRPGVLGTVARGLKELMQDFGENRRIRDQLVNYAYNPSPKAINELNERIQWLKYFPPALTTGSNIAFTNSLNRDINEPGVGMFGLVDNIALRGLKHVPVPKLLVPFR